MPEIHINQFFKASKAFFIGVSRYQSPFVPDLISPDFDIAELKRVLTDKHNFAVPGITVTDTAIARTLANPLIDPIKDNLLDFLKSIQCEADDRIIIYFAGHGIATNSDEEPEGYLLPVTALPGQTDTFVSMKEVMKELTKLKCRHLLLILDCCYAGAFRWAQNTRGLGLEVPKTIFFEKFEQYATNKAWHVLTSAAYDQKAIDTMRLGKRESSDTPQLSPFAQMLVTALETGEADLTYGTARSDGLITVTELGFYLRDRICTVLSGSGITIDKQQIPMLFPLHNDIKGEFVFISPMISEGKISLQHYTNENPYKGLKSYTIGDNKIFYGRKRVLDGWEDRKIKHEGLKSTVAANDLVIVTGPSGIGKSSLVRAGLLPLYKTAGNDNVVEMRPGKTPLTTNQQLLQNLGKSATGKVVLIDQFEELFTICRDEHEREGFEKWVVSLLPRHKIILTIRSDMESLFKSSILFLPNKNWKTARFPVPAFTREEIREIVLQPAEQEVLEFRAIKNTSEENNRFVERIVDESFLNPGSLPLLSLALSELYERKEERNLLESVYKDFNGIEGILDKKATAEYEKLTDENEKEWFRQLIFRMISQEGGRVAKRLIYTKLKTNDSLPDELLFTDTKKTQKIKEIGSVLVDSRLLITGTDEFLRDYIEPSHDALLRSWSLLMKWLKTLRKGEDELSRIHLHRIVSDFAALYAAADEKTKLGYLWINDPRLLRVREEIPERLNAAEEKFINDSYNRKVLLKKRRIAVRSIAIAVLAAVAVIVSILALNFKKESEKNKALYLASESNRYVPSDAIRLLEAANKLWPDNNIVMSSLLRQMQYATDINTFSFANIKIPEGYEVSDIDLSDSTVLFTSNRLTLGLVQSFAGNRTDTLQIEDGWFFEQVAFLRGKDLIAGLLSQRGKGATRIVLWNKKGDKLNEYLAEYFFNGIYISPTGKYIYGFAETGILTSPYTIKVGDGSSQLLPEIRGGSRILFHGDSIYIISGDTCTVSYNDKNIHTIKLPFEFDGSDHVNLSPDGSRLYVGNNRKGFLVDVATGNAFNVRGAEIAKFSLQNDLYLFATDSIYIFDTKGQSYYEDRHAGGEDWENYFLVTGEYAIYREKKESATAAARYIIHNVKEQKKFPLTYNGKSFYSVSRDGKILASDDDEYLRLWNFSAIKTEKLIRVTGDIIAIRYMDGHGSLLIESIHDGREEDPGAKYEIFNRERSRIYEKPYWGELLVNFPYLYNCSQDGDINVFLIEQEKTTRIDSLSFKLPFKLSNFKFNHNKTKILCKNSSSGKFMVIDLKTKQSKDLPFELRGYQMEVNPRADELLLFGATGSLIVNDMDTSKTVNVPVKYIVSAKYSPSGDFVVLETPSEKEGSDLAVYRKNKKPQILNFGADIESLQIAPDSKEFCVVARNGIKFSFFGADGDKPESEKIRENEQRMHSRKEIHDIQYSPDGKYILVIHANDMVLYDRVGNVVHNYENIQDLSTAIFSEDSKRILANQGGSVLEFFTPKGIIGWLKEGHIPPLRQELKDRYDIK